MTISEQIEKIEKEIQETPYHKATEHHIGKLRARLSKLREQLISGGKKTKGGGGGRGFAVKKQGHATCVFLGFPSVGKSTLLNKLTNAQSKIAPYAFTTITAIPGIMRYKGAYIQLVDLPGVIEQAALGKGRGKEVLSAVRTADIIILITEVSREKDFEKIKTELKAIGLVLDKKDFNPLIHTILPAIYIINKIDENPDFKEQDSNVSYISAEKEINLEKLKETIWNKLFLKRIYLKRKDKEPDRNNPLIVDKDSNIWEIARKVSSEMAQNVKGAHVWEGNAKFPNQEVSLNFIPIDETVVYLDIK